jgi:hypothetical protein
MNSWQTFMHEIQIHLKTLKAANCTEPYFRGHASEEWLLQPSLSRELSSPRFNENKEARLFWDFRMKGSHLLPSSMSEWTTLYYMQHYGLPTRLLDWTNCLATAVYFAISENPVSPCVWILDPYRLNSLTIGRKISSLNNSFQKDYLSFLEMRLPGAIAVLGDSSIHRIHAQQGAFTVHGDLTLPLEKFAPEAVKAFKIPLDALDDAYLFLELAGTDAFSIFPDLAGLAKAIRRKELS